MSLGELKGTELVLVNLQLIIKTSFMNLKEQLIGKLWTQINDWNNIIVQTFFKTIDLINHHHSDQFWEFGKVDK